MTTWQERHDHAVRFPSPSEAKVLALVTMAEQWAEVAESDYLAEGEVATPLLKAARSSLNWELGRLDAGTLDARLTTAATRAGIDPSQI